MISPINFQRHLLWLIVIASFWLFSSHAKATIGVGLHLGQGRHDYNLSLAALRLMGIDSFRDEISWNRLEDKAGQFRHDNVPIGLRRILQNYELASRSVIVLGYGNAHYDQGGRPATDLGFAAYARYAVEVATKYPQIGYLEIWNEWNHTTGSRDGSRGSAENYFKLVANAATALRSSGSKSKIVVGGLADDYPDWQFARQIVDFGVLEYADAFSVHLYNYSMGNRSTPSEFVERLVRLQNILRSANAGRSFPILVTEGGWPTNSGRFGSTELEAGTFISQFLFETLVHPWIEGTWIYELFDGGSKKDEREDNFGVLRQDGSAKTGTCLIRAAVTLLKNFQYESSGSTKSGARWHRFRKGDTSMVVVYSPARRGPADVEMRTVMGNDVHQLCQIPLDPKPLSRQTNWTKIAIGDLPMVFFLPNSNSAVINALR